MKQRYKNQLDPENLTKRFRIIGVLYLIFSVPGFAGLLFGIINDWVSNKLTRQLAIFGPVGLVALLAMLVAGVMAVCCGVRLKRVQACWVMGIVFGATMLLLDIIVFVIANNELQSIALVASPFPVFYLIMAWQLKKGLRYPPAPPFIPPQYIVPQYNIDNKYQEE